jgi:hypothetical protein
MSGLSFFKRKGRQMGRLPKGRATPRFRPLGSVVRAGVAQLVRALVCGTRGRWFKSTRLYHTNDDNDLAFVRRPNGALSVTHAGETPGASVVLLSPFKRAEGGSHRLTRPQNIELPLAAFSGTG